ncbi:FAD-dependent oxidoreductase [Demequina globuliformis]|uniref:FAD-dependent oxidoreductase n=1 Tax=Demequina globuliformis TaxID=676202 RepID=UPI000785ADCF|nr:FAD-dependent oxidoreductase [Demequina globuliformis]
MAHKVVIIGAVAAGMSAATRLRRLDEDAHIVVLEAGEHVSFANCGLPYYAGGVIEDREDLLLQTPESLRARFNLDVRTRSRATSIDPQAKTVTIDSREHGLMIESFDSLILAPGARPVVPPIPGAERALTLRDVADVDRMVARMDGAASAVVIGAGFVGLEVAENLALRGLKVTVVEMADQVLTALDPELAIRIEERLTSNGIHVTTGSRASEIADDAVVITGPNGTQRVAADLVIAAIGVTPDTHLARDAGLAIAPNGGIAVDEAMRTSAEHIYAVGDAAAKADAFGDSSVLIPLANLANRHGRRVADTITGRDVSPVASIGTAVVGVFGLTAAVTGRTERRLRTEGRPYRALHTHPLNHAGYYPGASALALKLLVDPTTDLILGAQAVGESGADKRIDIIATAIRGGLRASELADLELAYAPAYGSAKDPVNMLGYLAENAATGDTPSIQWHELTAADFVVDVRTAAEHGRGAVFTGGDTVNIDLNDLRARHQELPRDRRVVVHCQVGQRGHTATRLLRQLGYDAVNLDGGYLTWRDGQAATTRP